MTDYIVHAIYQTLTEYGESVLSTPQSLSVVLAKLSKASPGEMQAIAAAVHLGVVQDLRARPNCDIQGLSASLAARSGLPQHTAKWAIDVWKKSLHHFDNQQPPPDVTVDQFRATLDSPSPMAPYRRGVAATMLIALVGMVAGCLPGYLIPIGVERHHPQAVRIRQLVEHREQPGTRMSAQEFTKWIGSLGALGGLIGSAVGWLGGGFHRPTTIRMIAGLIGALWAFDGAIFGAAYAGIIGTLFGSMFLSAVMTYFAASIGAYGFLLILKPLAWFVLPHFH